MRGVDCNRGQHGIDAAFVECLCGERGFSIEFGHGKDPNGLLRERGKDLVVPALVLVAHENVHRVGDFGKFLLSGETVGADALRALLNLLKETGNADLDEFIEIVCRDCQEFDALKKWIARIAGFFEDTAIEFEPLEVAIEVVARVFELDSCHRFFRLVGEEKRYQPSVTGR